MSIFNSRAKATRAEPKDGGTIALDARYGFADGKQGAVEAEITSTPRGRKLVLTSRSDAVIVATQSADGVFNGTFTSKAGNARPVKLTRVTDSELAAALATPAAAVTKKPAPEREIVIVYWSSQDCPYCRQWEGSLGSEGKFRNMAEFQKIKFYTVKNERLAYGYQQEHFPPDIAWLWESYNAGKIKHPGRPGWQVFVDRKRVAAFQGAMGWEENHLPKIKQLIADNAKF